jgi:hypothetical protein
MVSQPSPTAVGLVFESLEASARVAQLEAEIAQLKDACARRQQIGVATGLLAQRFAHHPERAWSLLMRLSQKRPCQGTRHRPGHHQRTAVDAAQQSEILGVIEMHMPDGVRLIGARLEGQQPTSESSQ